ncbi:MAG TPA: ABC transporter permease, partial [Rhizomicrobium sp.]|nr:ABC transporter permease [Rhizomicrobium sp.]
LFFGATHVQSLPLFLFWVVSVSAVFGLLGIIVGLWSKSFEQLNMPVVFFLTPLSMVGGVFNTVAMLPSWLRWLAWSNPFFYFINGIRGAMIGVDETPPGLGAGLTLLLVAVLSVTVWRMYAKGYGLRE